MTLNEFIDVCNAMEADGDMTLRIYAFGTLGAAPEISGATKGIDWETNSVLLHTKHPLELHNRRLAKQMSIIDEVKRRRDYQDIKHGGPKHDDTHSSEDWIEFISEQQIQAMADQGTGRFCERMLDIAALAIAAIESYDRKDK